MDKQEINNAISEHAMWKFNLQALIERGKIDTPLAEPTDRECAFGRWFYGSSITPRQRSTAHYKAVRQLHVEFHELAARVATLAASGESEEAGRLMEPDGAYTVVSNRLMEALGRWKESVRR